MSQETIQPILPVIPEQTAIHISTIQKPIRASSLRSVNEFVNKDEESKVAVEKESIQINTQEKLRDLEICFVLKYLLTRNLYFQLFILIFGTALKLKDSFGQSVITGLVFGTTFLEVLFGSYNIIFYQDLKENHSDQNIFIVIAVQWFSYAFMYFGVFLNTLDLISSSRLAWFLIPYLLLSIFLFFNRLSLIGWLLVHPVFMLLESFQYFYVATYIVRGGLTESYDSVLFFFYFKSIISVCISLLMFVIIAIQFGVCAFYLGSFNIIQQLISFLAFYYGATNYLEYKVYRIAKTYIEKNIFGKLNNIKAFDEFNHDSLVMIAFGISFLLLTLVCYMKIESIFQAILSNQPQSIQIKDFTQKLKLRVAQVSENYFAIIKNDKKEPEPEIIKESFKIQDCLICFEMPSNTLIKPCGHSGFCENCIKNQLLQKQICPICRQAISKIYIIEYDEENKDYFATGVIDVRR